MSAFDDHLDNYGNPGINTGTCLDCGDPLPDDTEADYHKDCESES